MLMDTSVMVAVFVAAHPAHARATRCFERYLSRRTELFMCAHSLAELFAVLTRMPTAPRIGPDLANRLIQENIDIAGIRIVPLEAADYTEVIDGMAKAGFSGGIIYDMLIVQAARKAKAERIITLNEADFVRLCQGGSLAVASP